MRKSFFVLIGSCIAVSCFSQISLSAGATYSYFGIEHKKYLPGFQKRLMYETGPYGFGLSYTYHAPFRVPSYIRPYPNPEETSPPPNAGSEIRFQFQSIDFTVRRMILGNKDSKGNFYGGLGAGWVMWNFKEFPNSPLTIRPMNPLENSRLNKISLNGVIGGEYKLGGASLYCEASLAKPITPAYLPYHEWQKVTANRFGIQLGLKIPLYQR